MPPHIKKAKIYDPPITNIAKYRLFMNENLFGPAPHCIDRFKSFNKQDLLEYPYGGDSKLCSALAAFYSISENEVCLNHGSSEVLKQIFYMLLQRGDTVLLPCPGWGYYYALAQLVGAKSISYTLRMNQNSFEFDTKSIHDAFATHHPKVVVITSPNMPTGNLLPTHMLEYLLDTMPQTFFVIDEAYWGFDENNNLNIKKYIKQYDNVIFVRTFSKFFALASERIGYLIANYELCTQLKKGAPLFGISFGAQQTGIAALEATAYYDFIRKEYNKSKQLLSVLLNKTSELSVYISSANFVLIKVLNGQAAALVAYVGKYGFAIRECASYGLPSFVRVTVGSADLMTKLAGAINNFFENRKLSDAQY